MKKIKENWVIGVIAILYLVGLVGVSLPIHQEFMRLTPVNLLLCFGLVLYAQKDWNNGLLIGLFLCFSLGILVEMLGVQTGLIFGEYSYGETLGPKIMGTPLMMGVNWASLVLAVVSISNRLLKASAVWIKALLGASLMVCLDVFIEPVAIQYDFWTWSEVSSHFLLVAPIQNYLFWFIIAWALNLLLHYFKPKLENPSAEFLFYVQFVFFVWIVLQ